MGEGAFQMIGNAQTEEKGAGVWDIKCMLGRKYEKRSESGR